MRPDRETLAPLVQRRSGSDRRAVHEEQGRETLLARSLDRRGTVRRAVDRIIPMLEDTLHKRKNADLPAENRFRDFMESVGTILANDFGVGKSEVAILFASDGGAMLRFAYPVEFLAGTANMFPTAKQSIAGTVLKSGTGRIINNLAGTQHLVVYEQMKIGNEKARRIQKMISAPVMGTDKRAIGVIQVSRKGNTPEEAGADFVSSDLKRLVDIGECIGRALQEEIPSDF